MALIKQYELPYGITADYWRIDSLLIKAKKNINIAMYLYLNQDSRDAGSTALSIKEYTIDLPEDMNQDPIAYAYSVIKQHPDFSGAEDA